MTTETQTNRVTQTEHEPTNGLDDVIAQTTRQRASVRNIAAARLGVPPDKLFGLLRNVWSTSKDQPDLTDQELFAGVSMIARFELDPIAREIYVSRDGKGRLMNIVSVDGWVKILDRTDHYDGFEQELHFSKDGKTLEWVETKIYSTKRSHPTPYRAFATEYARVGGFVSKSIPWHMLRIFSLRHAARLFVPLGGTVVSEEEAAAMMREGEQHMSPQEPVDYAGRTKSQQVAEQLRQRKEAPSGSTVSQSASAMCAAGVLPARDAKQGPAKTPTSAGERGQPAEGSGVSGPDLTPEAPSSDLLTPAEVDEQLAKAAESGRRTDVVELGNQLQQRARDEGDRPLGEYVFEAVERVCGEMQK